MKENFANKNNNSGGNKKEEYYAGVGAFIFEMVKVALLALVIIVPIRVFLFQPFFVQGASMEPNFEDGQYLIINEFGIKQTKIGSESHTIFEVKPFRELKRQEVVVFRYPMDKKKFFIKRIIGLPNEKVQIKKGEVYIFNEEKEDGFILDEKEYLPIGLKTKEDMSVELKDDEYFVMGDNRMFSSDSRAWGPITKSEIIGKVLIRAWPLDKVSFFK
jgi:signal peptidase I